MRVPTGTVATHDRPQTTDPQAAESAPTAQRPSNTHDVRQATQHDITVGVTETATGRTVTSRKPRPLRTRVTPHISPTNAMQVPTWVAPPHATQAPSYVAPSGTETHTQTTTMTNATTPGPLKSEGRGGGGGGGAPPVTTSASKMDPPPPANRIFGSRNRLSPLYCSALTAFLACTAPSEPLSRGDSQASP